MTPVTPRLLLALGALVVVAWLVTPVSSSPPPQHLAPAPPTVEVTLPVAPELAELNGEVERLRLRLAEPARPSEPVRDPFQYAASPIEAVPSGRSLIDLDAVPFEPERSAVVWPSLVAILSSGSDEVPTRQAVLAGASQLLEFRSVGEALGDVVVSGITAEHVTLTHAPSGESTHLSLR